jgi:hypothetical protein
MPRTSRPLRTGTAIGSHMTSDETLNLYSPRYLCPGPGRGGPTACPQVSAWADCAETASPPRRRGPREAAGPLRGPRAGRPVGPPSSHCQSAEAEDRSEAETFSAHFKAPSTQSRSSWACAAPLVRASARPRCVTSSVGRPCTSKRCTSCGVSSTLTLTSFALPAKDTANFSRTEFDLRDGTHQRLQKSTTTGIGTDSATWAKSSSDASTTQGRER